MDDPRPARFKLTDVEWNVVKDEIRLILIDVARQRQTITYSGLCLRLHSVRLHYHSFIFHKILREVCREVWEQGGGQLCALVVAKQTGIPGGGYWTGLDALPADDLVALWQQDLDDVYDKWSDRAAGL